MIFGQPQLGFSITDPFKKVGKAVYKAHVVGTQALVSAVKNPNVQKAAVAAGTAYAQQKYPGQYAKAMDYADKARGIIRPPAPQAPVPVPQMAPPDEDGPMVAPMPGGGVGPVQKGNMMTLALIGGAVVLLVVMMKK